MGYANTRGRHMIAKVRANKYGDALGALDIVPQRSGLPVRIGKRLRKDAGFSTD